MFYNFLLEFLNYDFADNCQPWFVICLYLWLKMIIIKNHLYNITQNGDLRGDGCMMTSSWWVSILVSIMSKYIGSKQWYTNILMRIAASKKYVNYIIWRGKYLLTSVMKEGREFNYSNNEMMHIQKLIAYYYYSILKTLHKM